MLTVDEVEPSRKTPVAKLWEVDIPRADPKSAATVGCWVMEAPNNHPFWSHYLISIIHLREVEGWPPVHKVHPALTHELAIHALNPDKPVSATTRDSWNLLMPVNILVQYQSKSDLHAALLIEGLLDRVLKGTLSLDTDYGEVWRGLLAVKPLTEVHLH